MLKIKHICMRDILDDNLDEKINEKLINLNIDINNIISINRCFTHYTSYIYIWYKE